MKKLIAVAILTLIGASNADAKAVVKGTGGMTTDGKTRNYCPKPSDSICAIVTNNNNDNTYNDIHIGDIVQVETNGGIDQGVVVMIGANGITIQ